MSAQNSNHDELVDLDQETYYDSQGRRITEDYVAQAATEVESEELPVDEDQAVFPRRGRPSLSGTDDVPSPRVITRVTPELKRELTRVAQAQHRPESDVMREALSDYLARH